MSALPAPTTEQDIGPVGVAGSSSISGGTYTVTGSGFDLFTPIDTFHYVYEPLSGDGTIVARVLTVGNSDPSTGQSKGAIDLRSSLNDNSTDVNLALQANNQVALNSRTSTGAASQNLQLFAPPTSQGSPLWLELVRTGTTVNAFTSVDGIVWSKTSATATLPAGPAFVGLGVDSNTTNTANTATFDNVTVTDDPPPLAQVTTPVPTVTSAPGSGTAGGATFTFGVTYSDNSAVSAASLGNANVFVNGPNGYKQNATLVTSSGSGATITATYQATVPNGQTWTTNDNGNYTINVNPAGAGSVTDNAGNPVLGGVISNFLVAVGQADTTPPTVTLTSAPSFTAAASSYGFSVSYSDNVAVKASSLGGGNILVTGPGGYSASATLVSTGLSDNPTIGANYTVPGPTTNGTYTISIQPHSVFDTSPTPNAVAAGPIGSFTVSLPAGGGGGGGGQSGLVASFATGFPAAVIGGARGKTRIQLTNNGPDVVSGANEIELLASPDGNLADGTVITTSAAHLHLKVGQSKLITVNFKFPASLPDGSYQLLADVNNSTTNFGASSPVTIAAPFVNLTASMGSLPASVLLRKKLPIALTINNIGNSQASGPIAIALYYSGDQNVDATSTLVNTFNTSVHIKPGGSQKVKLSLPANSVPQGSFDIVALVNSTNTLTESSTSDNVAASASPVAFS